MNVTKIQTRLAVAAGLAGAALAAQAADYAQVLSATPVTAAVATPQQECFDAPQVVQQQPSGGGALIGAIVGGVVGNQFGHGVGRAAATGLGVVAGSAIGNNVEANNGAVTTVASRRCRTVRRVDDRVVGYDVVYEYNGQRYSTRLPRDPGPRLAIDVRPVGNTAPAYAAAPPAYVDEPRQAYVEPAPSYSYDGQAPAAYYAPAPVYYGSSYGYGYGPGAYVGPAIIGAGIGYWVGSSWHRGYRHGYYGGRGRWR